MLIKSGWFM